MGYKHGAYGEITESKVTEIKQANVVAAYIGTAPINLIRGYAELDLVNMPLKISNMNDVTSKVGFSEDWEKFTLCETFKQHFDNSVSDTEEDITGNVGPIYIVNILNPDTCKSSEKTTKALVFTNKRAEFKCSDIILDTLAIEDKVEGVDYTLEYNFKKGSVIVNLLKDIESPTVSCTFNTVDTSRITKNDVIGSQTEEGEYTGLYALKLLYQYHNAILNILAAPGWSHIPEVYKAMVSITQKLNGHWDGFVNADIPLEDEKGSKINTIAKAIEWKSENGYNYENSKVYWPKIQDSDGRVYHISTSATATMLRTDLKNNGVPFESPSNKEIMATKQYFGEDSNSRGFDQETANKLNENGITTACFWNGAWVLWGPHTAAYKYHDETDAEQVEIDARAIFDVNLRMLMYITNSFQVDHGTEIDSPMTPQDKDTVLNFEKQKLDNLCGIGALIGTPTIEFLEVNNPTTNLMNGDFVWNFAVTNTPPCKSETARICYTDEGFSAFFSE